MKSFLQFSYVLVRYDISITIGYESKEKNRTIRFFFIVKIKKMKSKLNENNLQAIFNYLFTLFKYYSSKKVQI